MPAAKTASPASVRTAHCPAPAVCCQSSPVQLSSHWRPSPQTSPKSAMHAEPANGIAASEGARRCPPDLLIAVLLCHSKPAMSIPGDSSRVRVLERLDEL